MKMKVTPSSLLFMCVFIGTVGVSHADFDPRFLAAILPQVNDTTVLDYLVSQIEADDITLRSLREVVEATLPILEMDVPHGWFRKTIFPWLLRHLPDLLKNEEFVGIANAFITELNQYNQSLDWIPVSVLQSGNQIAKLEYFVHGLLSELHYSQMFANLLMYRSARDFFPINSTDRPLDEQCYMDTMAFADRLLAGDEWALDMFDAVGKPTTGIRRGVLYFAGTYDECVNVKARIPLNASLGQYVADTDMAFKGKYCRATFTPPTSLVQSVAGNHINNTYGIPLTLSWGLCLPDSCKSDDIEGLLNLGILGQWFNVTVRDAVCEEEPDFKHDQGSQIVVGILGGLVLLVIISSFIDLFCLQDKRHAGLDNAMMMTELNFHDNNAYVDLPESKAETAEYNVAETSDKTVNPEELRPGLEKNERVNGKVLKDIKASLNMSVDSDLTENNLDNIDPELESASSKLLRSFSIFTNLRAVMSTEVKDDTIACLHGVRVLTMMWIVLGNTYLYMVQSVAEVPVAVDLMDSFDLMKRFTMQDVMSAALATDTFFMISGCLVAYWFLSRGSWIKFYISRYWKMTPPYVLVMVSFVYLYTYAGKGPMWPKSIPVADSCRTDWWKHLVYVNNLVGVEGVAPEQQCMAWSWQLAVTMQLYLVSPLLLSLVLYSAPMGLAVTGIAAAAGIVATGVKEADYGGEILTSRLDHGDYWNNVFIKPWCRLAPYCVGIFLGFVLHTWNEKKMNKVVALFCWVVAVCVGVFVIYIPYTKYVDDLGPWSDTLQAVYEALGRPVWAICAAWVVYACAAELAGPVSELLSWKGFVPLSRITYHVYLIHPVLMVLVVYSRRTLAHLNDFDMAYMFVGHVVISYAAGVVTALVFDFPFRNLKRIVQKKPLDTPY